MVLTLRPDFYPCLTHSTRTATMPSLTTVILWICVSWILDTRSSSSWRKVLRSKCIGKFWKSMFFNGDTFLQTAALVESSNTIGTSTAPSRPELPTWTILTTSVLLLSIRCWATVRPPTRSFSAPPTLFRQWQWIQELWSKSPLTLFFKFRIVLQV